MTSDSGQTTAFSTYSRNLVLLLLVLYTFVNLNFLLVPALFA